MKFILMGIFMGSLLLMSEEARAVLINFDDQGLTGPSQFASTSGVQPLDISTSAGHVAFNGGVILTSTTHQPADQTSVYGTADKFLAPGLVNPLTITFDQPVTNVLIDIVNGLDLPVTYQVADNLGHSSTFALPRNTSSGLETIGLVTSGTQLTVTSLTFGNSAFDFFIDTIQFDLPIACGPDGCAVPEPGTVPLLVGGLAGVVWLRRRTLRPA